MSSGDAKADAEPPKANEFEARELPVTNDDANRKKSKIPVKTKNSFQSLTKMNNDSESN